MVLTDATVPKVFKESQDLQVLMANEDRWEIPARKA
jgi:hypothetical protein